MAAGTLGVCLHVRDDSPNCGVVGAVEGGSRLDEPDEEEADIEVGSRNGKVGSRYSSGEVAVDPGARGVEAPGKDVGC